ncbi:MAG TPA: FAD-dependent oxidoreductase [Jatrophihabitantaceae bacterium]|nr:FAD-dependent oxidoreductase [Jatrophihabitantaceae bacterium]
MPAAASAPAGLDVHPPHGDTVWDLLVIGGGTAGMVAARTASGFRASVLLAERDRTGGDCLWTGCVPSKALIAAAAAAADARRAASVGVHADGVRVDFAAVMAHVNGAIAAIEPDDSPGTLAAAGVRIVHGVARFAGPTTAEIDGRPLRFRQAIVATGSQPILPPIPGLEAVQPLTSDTVWGLTSLPQRLLVLGGGSIGCELGQAYARLGSHVDIIETAPRLLLREDSDAADVLTAALLRDGVDVRTGVTVTAIRPGADGAGTAELDDGTAVEFDRMLVATGRRPRTDKLRLDLAGVAVDERGYVAVNTQLRTSNRRVWAAGDVTGHPQFTHTAGMHASLAASNALLGLRRHAELAAMPRVTFTQPEIAAVGIDTGTADRGHRLTSRTVRHEHVDRAVTDGHTEGFTRVVLDGRGRVLGATVVGPRAGETLAELTLAVRRGLRAADLAGTTHAYPTYGYGPWDAAIEDVRHRLGRPLAARTITTLIALRRRWIDARGRFG